MRESLNFLRFSHEACGSALKPMRQLWLIRETMKHCEIGDFHAKQIFLSFVLIQKKQKIKKQQAVREKTQWLRCYDCRCKTSCVVLQTQAPIVQRDATAFFLSLTSLLLRRSRVDTSNFTSGEERLYFEYILFVNAQTFFVRSMIFVIRRTK